MNKKLLTAAIGAALAASPMLVSAAGPTVYGKFNVGVASIDDGVNSTTVVTDDASRFGVKGDEDLGGGLKAIYQMEVTYDADENGGFGTGRDVYIGLAGGWGSLRVGQYNTAYKLVSVPVEYFGDTIADFTANGFSGETRQRNNIGYTSPNFGGFMFKVEYAAQNETESAAVQAINPINASLGWKSGPFYAAVGYYDFDNAAAALDSSMKLAAEWNPKPFKVAFVYEDQDPNTGGVVTDMWVVNGAWAFGNNEVALSYSSYEGDAGSGVVLASGAECTMIGLGLFHYFSKTTKGLLVYNDVDNDSGAACAGRLAGNASSHGLMTGGVAPGFGIDPSGFQIGIQKSF